MVKRHARLVRAVAGLIVCLAIDGSASAQELPRVRLVATGGTISNRSGGRLTADDLIGLIPDVRRYARPESEQFSNVSSSELTLKQWLTLSRRLNELFASDTGLAGIVVTSGTDTLEELAYFLHLTVRDARPVVVVGSMRNPSTVGYEGAANLLEAFRVAASADARGKGVLVVMNDEINSAREVTKTDALRLQTFQSRTTGVLGVVDGDRVVFYRGVVKRHTAASEFDVSKITELPRVDVLLVYQDAPGDLIKAAVDFGAQGLVVAAAGAGATSGTQFEGLSYAAAKGVTVVTTTRTGSGRISSMRMFGPPPVQPQVAGGAAGAAAPAGQPAPRRARAAFVGGEDLAPVKARVLLMLALATTRDPAEIQRMFLEY
jgi:L-asparaginase